MTTYAKWKEEYKNKRPGERLGQAFANDFIKGVWVDLYYNINESEVQGMIVQYLKDKQYWPNVPPFIDQSAREAFFNHGN